MTMAEQGKKVFNLVISDWKCQQTRPD